MYLHLHPCVAFVGDESSRNNFVGLLCRFNEFLPEYVQERREEGRGWRGEEQHAGVLLSWVLVCWCAGVLLAAVLFVLLYGTAC